MTKESKYTSWKVIISYILIVAISFLSAFLIYKQVAYLVRNDTYFSKASQKIFIISSTLSKLYEAEVLGSAFAQTGKQTYFKSFISAIQETQKNIDTLKQFSYDTVQCHRLDSVRTLLGEKIKNLQELVWVKQSFSPEEFYNKAIASISGQDTLSIKPKINQQNIPNIDTNKKVIKRWIFSKIISDTIMPMDVSQKIIQDTLHTWENIQYTDTIVNILRNTWKDVQRHSQNINQKINQQENTLIRQNTQIAKQLKRILKAYEQEELNNTFQQQQKREHGISKTIQVLTWIAIIAILFIIFFVFFILRDLSRSQCYRQELEQANTYSDQLLKSREKMIQTVTHDIKSPLSSILGYIELLHHDTENEKQLYFLRNMQKSSEHILQLVHNLLDFSKLENNKIILENITFTPKQLFQEISDTFLPLALKKQLTLTTKLDEDLNQSITGDALRIRQIITNILSNAIKYTTEGNITFSAYISQDKKHINIQIQDTGCGLTLEEQELIFKEFARLKYHKNIEGTGLGLTITIKLIQLLGGELQLNSQPGQGSCFTILLPFTFAENSTEDFTHSILIEDQQKHTNAYQHLKVLLVDDDPIQLAMTQHLLEKEGITIEKTTYPKEALQYLQNTTYNLVFSDIQMPEMDGFELVKQIRNINQNQTLPVVALSANAHFQKSDYIQQGFDTYLSKPFSALALFQVIHELTGFAIPQTLIQPKQAIHSNDNQTYTLKNIQRFTDNNPETLRSILQAFTSSTQEHLLLLEQYLEAHKYDDISRLAHKMLPMFRQLEAQLCIEPLETLERKTQYDLSTTEIEKLTQRSIEQIRKLLQLIP